MPTGIDLIIADHRMVDELFAAYAGDPRASTIAQIVDALKAHDEAEQAALYPLVAEVLGAGPVLEGALTAHAALKRQIEVVTSLEGGPFDAAAAELQRLVQAHVADEEARILPALAERATPAQLDALGARILQAKQRVG
jgi:hemerythrin superfamily protein